MRCTCRQARRLSWRREKSCEQRARRPCGEASVEPREKRVVGHLAATSAGDSCKKAEWRAVIVSPFQAEPIGTDVGDDEGLPS